MIPPVDVVCGGPGREHDVSVTSGKAVYQALLSAGVDARLVTVDQTLELSQLRSGSVVFNVIHGTYGEDGTLQQVLDEAGRVYVGSGVAASRLCMDKDATKSMAQAAGIPVAWGRGLDVRNPMGIRDLVPPTLTGLVIKPRCDGSSVGLRFIPSKSFLLPTIEELIHELGPIPLLVEERLPGPEYTVAIIEQPDRSVQTLPPIAIVPAAGSYDYAAKYQRDDTAYEPVDDETLAQSLQALAEKAYLAAGCRDFARVDFMLNASAQPCLLELNTLPGFTNHSLVPKAAQWVGMDFNALCLHLIQLAAGRLTQ